MKFIVSRYNQDVEWVKDYTDDYVIYDRSEKPVEGAILMPNIGSDIYDKLTFIINNYDDLPEVAVYCKANLFKYITSTEFAALKDNQHFTPLLTQEHKTTPGVSFYDNGIYKEINSRWYLTPHPAKQADLLMEILRIKDLDYIPFAPGANYILTKKDIQKHSKEFYQLLRSFIDYDVYPGEAQIMERGLYTLWS